MQLFRYLLSKIFKLMVLDLTHYLPERQVVSLKISLRCIVKEIPILYRTAKTLKVPMPS